MATVLWGNLVTVETSFTANLWDPRVEALADGSYAVFWRNLGDSAEARRFGADSSAIGTKTTILTKSVGPLQEIDTAVLADGRFAISTLQAPAGSTPATRVAVVKVFALDDPASGISFTASGTRGAGVNVVATPQGEGIAAGGVGIVHRDYNNPPGGWNQLTIYDAGDGSVQGFNGNVYASDTSSGAYHASANKQKFSTVVLDDRIVVLSNDNTRTSADPSPMTVTGTILNLDGTPKAGLSAFTVPSGAGIKLMPASAALDDGRFVVAWRNEMASSSTDPSSGSIRGRIFDRDGKPQGEEFQVNTTTNGDQMLPMVAKLPGGGFVVAFTDTSEAGSSTDWGLYSIRLQAFDRHGNKAGGEIQVTNPKGLTSSGLGLVSDMTALADGRTVVVWSSDISTIIRSQIVDARFEAVKVEGTAKADHYIGTAFNDTLNGAGGADRLDGGAGDDTYVIDDVADQILDSAGRDTVVAGISYSLADKPFIEDLTATGAASLALTGNGAANTITGNAGANTLDGGGGADVMIGGAGDDTYVVDSLADQVSDSAGADTVITRISYSLVDKPTIENLTVAGSASVALTGNGTANRLLGGDGADTLDGGGGADLLIGGAGDDTYVLDNPGDVVSDSAGFDTVVAFFNYTLQDGSNIERLITSESATSLSLKGNGSDNVLVGTAGNDSLDGGAGADQMLGGAGNDTYYLDSMGDAIIDASGIDTVNVSFDYALATGLENLTALGSAGLALKGNAGSNVIKGNDGANRLYGGQGRDELSGAGGKDIFVFDAKADRKKTHVDKIVDFNVKADTIWLDNAAFKKLGKGTDKKPGKVSKDFFTLGSKAKDANDYLIYDSKKGVLSYDADGSGKGAAYQIATLSKKLKMTEKDFFVV